jgi:hypothetical protein
MIKIWFSNSIRPFSGIKGIIAGYPKVWDGHIGLFDNMSDSDSIRIMKLLMHNNIHGIILNGVGSI